MTRYVLGIGAGVLAVAAAWAGFAWWQAHELRADLGRAAFDLSPGVAPVDILTPAEIPPGWKTYQNARYHVALGYPPELSVKEYDEGGDAMTVVFQNTDKQNAEGFQIFIVPYAQSQITEGQFLKDEPSGVRTGVQTTAVGGVLAASFFGRDQLLGDTAEVWFINGGYLYEVSTVKPLAEWLAPIVQTWRFVK